MAETLTQAEIDALRDAVKSGKIEDVAKQEVRPAPREFKVVGYDFRKPQLLSADNLLALQTLHQTLAKSIQGLLFSMFKVTAETTLSSMDQVSYGEFMLSLETPTYLLGLSLQSDYGPVGMEISPPLGPQILDMLLGGEGSLEDPSQGSREFTILELEILRTWTDRVLDEIQAGWETIQPMQISVTSTGIEPDQIQVVPGDTPCICVGIHIGMHNTTGRIHICYPFSTLQAIFQKAAQEQDDESGRRAEMRKSTLRALQQVPLEVNAELGRALITARELRALQPGDIIKLNHRAAEPLTVNLGETPIGDGIIGSRRGQTAIALKTIIRTVTPAKAQPQQAAAAGKPPSPPPPIRTAPPATKPKA